MGSIPTCVGQPGHTMTARALRPVYPHVCGAAPLSFARRRRGKGLSPRVWGSHLRRHMSPGYVRSIPTCVGQPAHWIRRYLRPTVYPHVCGAAGTWLQTTPGRDGLSPRVWGSQRYALGQTMPEGSIPTCVGQPNLAAKEHEIRLVYPHVCGAARSFFFCEQWRWGLSPRVWGSRLDRKPGGRWGRSIPTCVGQPLDGRSHSRHCRVYPHVCGAATGGCCETSGLCGLSPRVWGSRSIGMPKSKWERSIPTCVGQPHPYESAFCVLKVYPHVCGAAVLFFETLEPFQGLSPRVWGSQILSVRMNHSRRSIPTCVGQPGAGGGWIVRVEVYPHVCGAAAGVISSIGEMGGLSPRVWGSLRDHVSIDTVDRSIPTCVGQPILRRWRSWQRAVYPHVCGAALDRMHKQHSVMGLSPRVWGSPSFSSAHFLLSRSIPTCVGQPIL